MKKLFQRNKQPKEQIRPYKLPLFIKFLDKIQGVFTKSGVNYPQMRLIIKTKLIMDTRIDAKHLDGFGAKQKEGKNKYFQSVGLNLFMGLFMIALHFFKIPSFSKYGLILTAGFFMLLMSLLQSFSGLLLNPHDREIMGTRGVTDKTLNIARFTYISYYVFAIFFSLLGPSIIASIFIDGPLTGIIFTVMAIMLGLTTLFMAMLLYLLILKTFSGEQLKNMLNTLQILMVILMVSIFYIPQFMSINSLELFPKTFMWFYTFTFPVWFAAPVALASFSGITTNLIVLSILAVTLTFLMYYLYKQNAGQFELYLGKLTSNEGARNKNSWWFKTSTRLSTRNSQEQTYYKLAWRIMQNEREFKLKSYPQFGLGIFILAIMLFSTTRTIFADMNTTLFSPEGFDYMIKHGLFGMLSFAPIFGAIFTGISLDQSTQASGFTILNSIPNASPNLFRRATLKAVIFKLFLPINLFFDLIALPFVPLKYYHLLIVGPALSIFLFMLVTAFFLREPPFNTIPTPTKSAASSAKGAIISVLLIWFAMALAFAIYFIWWLSLITIILSVVGILIIMYKVKIKSPIFYTE